MLKVGMYVRCPIDREYPENPRLFATGKVLELDEFNECAHIIFCDPFGYKKYFDQIPEDVNNAPLSMLDHCHLFKGSIVKMGHKTATIIEYKANKDDFVVYYLQINETKEFIKADESKITASFFSGSANPEHQLKNYEFQNPC